MAVVICALGRDFWYPDEPDMADVTRQMVARADWLQLWLYRKPFDDYPPLYFWITSLFASVLGFSELALRLPTALAGIGLLLATGAWAKRRVGASEARWIAIVLGTMYLFFWQSINMHLDMVLAVFVASSIYAFDAAASARSRRARWLLRILSAAAMGAAALTKGPVGIALPSCVLGIAALLARDWRRIVALFAVAAIAGLVFLAWAAAFARNSGTDSVVYFLTKQNVDRFLGGRAHERPIYYYLVSIAYDLLPWSLLLSPACLYAWRRARRADTALQLALAWLVFGFVFFSLAASKRNVYFLPIVPAAAILIGARVAALFEDAGEPDRLTRRLLGGLGALYATSGIATAAGSYWVAQRIGRGSDVVALTIAVGSLIAASGAVLLVSVLRGQVKRALALVPVIALAGYLAAFGAWLPALDDPLSAKHDSRWLSARVGDSEQPVGYFHPARLQLPKESSALEFYGQFLIQALSQREEVRAFLDAQPDGVILVEDDGVDELEARAEQRFAVEREIVIGDDRLLAVSAARAEPSNPRD